MKFVLKIQEKLKKMFNNFIEAINNKLQYFPVPNSASINKNQNTSPLLFLISGLLSVVYLIIITGLGESKRDSHVPCNYQIIDSIELFQLLKEVDIVNKKVAFINESESKINPYYINDVLQKRIDLKNDYTKILDEKCNKLIIQTRQEMFLYWYNILTLAYHIVQPLLLATACCFARQMILYRRALHRECNEESLCCLIAILPYIVIVMGTIFEDPLRYLKPQRKCYFAFPRG